MTEIHVDYRETGLLHELQGCHVDATVISKNLEIGDIHIVTKTGVSLVFERKTLADLAASIKDGRYKEQKHRMLSSIAPRHITYIIEGGQLCGRDQHGINGTTYEGVYINTMYRDGCHVIFVKDVKETAEWLTKVATRCEAHPDKFSATQTSEEYHTSCKAKTRKIENITPKTCYIMQLCQIPGVSKKVAEVIQTAYPTMCALVTKLAESCDPVKELSKLQLIGAKKAQCIVNYILNT
jgi:ERCC4-type nuclease